jgi:hypothetical protein
MIYVYFQNVKYTGNDNIFIKYGNSLSFLVSKKHVTNIFVSDKKLDHAIDNALENQNITLIITDNIDFILIENINPPTTSNNLNNLVASLYIQME